MVHLTKADIAWITELLVLTAGIYDDYPELFNAKDEEVLKITSQLIGSLK